jgi:glycylpeptide N-tetradecanoyltransferase
MGADLGVVQEIKEVYTLLTNNYVEDDDNMFRFDYSKEFLRWALKLPGYLKQWHIGVRAKTSKKLVAFISGQGRLCSKEMGRYFWQFGGDWGPGLS